jgi:hypothetical protein
VLENNTLIDTSEDVAKLLELIKPLLVDTEGQEAGYLGSVHTLFFSFLFVSLFFSFSSYKLNVFLWNQP